MTNTSDCTQIPIAYDVKDSTYNDYSTDYDIFSGNPFNLDKQNDHITGCTVNGLSIDYTVAAAVRISRYSNSSKTVSYTCDGRGNNITRVFIAHLLLPVNHFANHLKFFRAWRRLVKEAAL